MERDKSTWQSEEDKTVFQIYSLEVYLEFLKKHLEELRAEEEPIDYSRYE
jgi:hypothetical protein